VSDAADDVVHSITVNGEHKEGVDLVLMHGFANGGGCFFRNIANLATHEKRGGMGRTHIVDWRGAGMSGRPAPYPAKNEQEAIDFFVEGLEAWRVARLGPEGRFVLLGHSLGSVIASNYTKKYPKHVRHLLLAGPAGVKRPDDAKYASLVTRTFMHRVFVYFWEAGVTPQMVFRVLPGRIVPRFVRWYVLARWQGGGPLDERTVHLVSTYATGVVLMRGCSDSCLSRILRPFGMARTPIGPVVEGLKDTPVTFIYGERDWMTPANGVEVVARMKAAGRKDAEAHVLPNAAHYPFIDQPVMFDNILAAACVTGAKR